MSDKLKARMQGQRSPRVIVGRLTTNFSTSQSNGMKQ